MQDMWEEESFNEQASIGYIGENKIVMDNLEVNSGIEEDNFVKQNEIEILEDDVDLLEVVKETFDAGNPFDLKERKYFSEVNHDGKYLSENEEQSVNMIFSAIS